MKMILAAISFVVLSMLGGCERRVEVEVSHPFYLTYPEDPDDMALFRCIDGPEGGCERGHFPKAKIVAAGANDKFVTMKQVRDGKTGYYYFARIPQETSGWGKHPEVVVGPMSASEFKANKARLALPNLDVVP